VINTVPDVNTLKTRSNMDNEKSGRVFGEIAAHLVALCLLVLLAMFLAWIVLEIKEILF